MAALSLITEYLGTRNIVDLNPAGFIGMQKKKEKKRPTHNWSHLVTFN
jgi:hypothetical protein